MSALQPIYNKAILYKQGLNVSVASNTTLSVASGLARTINDNMDINLGDFFGAKTSTVLNTGFVGLNGIDTGILAASKVYAVYLIADQAGYNASGLLLSLNTSNTPVMPIGQFPSGYNVIRRIGWAVTDSSVHFSAMTTSGSANTVIYTLDTPLLVLNAGTSATQAVVGLGAAVPAVAGIPVMLSGDFLSDAASKTAKISTSGGTIANTRFVLNSQVAAVHLMQDFLIPATLISGVPSVDYIISATTSTLSLYVNGFVDLL